MPRKAKIVAVPVDAATVAEPVEQTAQEDKTDAEEMTNVINEIKTEDQPVTQEVAEPTAEPKPKRAPRARAPTRKRVKELDAEVVDVEPTLEETAVEVTLPEEKPAAVVKDKVACPDCGKEMSAKTLKYSHAPNCVIKKKQSDEQPAAVVPDRRRDSPEGNISEELIEELVQKRWDNVSNNLRRERLARKQAMMEKLISGAF
jgi:hypothetical protein